MTTRSRSDDDADPAVAGMSPEQQVAHYRSEARKFEDLARTRGDYDEIKADRDRLREESELELADHIAAARRGARAELAPELVRLAFRAEARGVLTDDQRDALLEDLDLTKYPHRQGRGRHRQGRQEGRCARAGQRSRWQDVGDTKRSGRPPELINQGWDASPRARAAMLHPDEIRPPCLR